MTDFSWRFQEMSRTPCHLWRFVVFRHGYALLDIEAQNLVKFYQIRHSSAHIIVMFSQIRHNQQIQIRQSFNGPIFQVQIAWTHLSCRTQMVYKIIERKNTSRMLLSEFFWIYSGFNLLSFIFQNLWCIGKTSIIFFHLKNQFFSLIKVLLGWVRFIMCSRGHWKKS